jgi:choline dehydrogenase-like flavoprotein/alpha-beta hydrolase superfamily lysophospholipase
MTNNNKYDTSRASWMAHGLEELLDSNGGNVPEFDVIIVGSGYGGAIAASTLAGRTHEGNSIKVCILERGNEYLSGMFPSGLAELPTHVRVDQSKEGLFDARPGPDVTTLVANGLGGGSLINAGVMEVPRANVFQHRWPAALSSLSTWETYYDRARTLLGAGTAANPNTIGDHPDGIPTKTSAFEDIANPSSSFRHAALTVAMRDSQSSASVNLNKCLRCGDCATGCNHGAKISLDVGLLAQAHRKGVEIYSGATVLNVEKDNDEWIVNTVFTNATLRERLQKNSGPARIRAKKLILAAGTLGSTEILMRSELDLNFSDELGKNCSTNGDMLITDYATRDAVRTVANENVRPSDRSVGPTITGIVDLRDSKGILIEEMSVPAGMRRVFTEIFATTNALHRLNRADFSSHQNGFPDEDIYAVHHEDINKSALYAVMGDDGAAGEIELTGDVNDERDGIGRITWPGVQELDLFDNQVETLTDLTDHTGGDIIANPAWNLLPKEMSFLLDSQHGPVITVHPLGGCAMADNVNDGVVDDLGRVYNADVGETYHDGLVVLDGAIIPTALGTNPALTIAAVALRASEALATQWGYQPTVSLPLLPIDRPVARSTDDAFEPEGTTQIQVCERMFGEVDFLDADGNVRPCVVELTMRFEELPVSRLTYADDDRPAELTLDATADGEVTASRIRIFNKNDWETFEREHVPDRSVDDVLDELAILRAPLLAGTLRVFERGRSSVLCRIFRAGWAYLINRGLRDIWQAIFDPGGGSGGLARGWQRIIGFFRLTTRAGEKRWFHYKLRIGTPDASSEIQLVDDQIVGRKLFTYKRRANPWRQLLQMQLRRFPGMQDDCPRTLELDQQFLTRIGIPLIRITQQSDGVTALAELGSFFAYLSRLMLGIHVWSFQRPDRDLNPVPVDPRPGVVPDLSVTPQVFSVPLDAELPDGAEDNRLVAGLVRLVLYESQGSTKAPVVMFHGYSASGTTFAHRAIDLGLAKRFHDSGRDVWVADLRSSACMVGREFLDGEYLPPTATEPWSMEQMAYRDVPEAINFIYDHYNTPGKEIDVLAHCMGAVMFSMAALADASDINWRYTPEQRPRVLELLSALPGRIRRVAFSQVGPLVVFSPANRFRAYATRYLRELLPGEYSFNPPDPPSLADQMLDRVLSTLPYPEEEFDYENPKWPCKRTPWTRTRHRMDALYGRDFNVRNMSGDMLRHINDHFGALNIKTVTQTMHFARYNTITDRTGYNRFVSRSTLTDDNWKFPVFSIHGSNNGLSDVTTVDRMRQILTDAGRNYRSYIIEDAGHQDALIGDGRQEMATRLIDYFDDTGNYDSGDAKEGFVALTPWIGPIFTLEGNPPIPYMRIGARPSMREPETILMLRVQIVDNEIRRHNDGMPFDAGDENFILTNMVTYTSDNFRANRWDSFAMPLPPAVPLGGDALLVLVLYAEAEALPTAGETYLSFLTGPFGAPIEIVQVDPLDWSGNVWVPPSLDPLESPDEARERMRRIARRIASDSLATLLNQQRAQQAGNQFIIDPNGVVLPAVSDPPDIDSGIDPVD